MPTVITKYAKEAGSGKLKRITETMERSFDPPQALIVTARDEVPVVYEAERERLNSARAAALARVADIDARIAELDKVGR